MTTHRRWSRLAITGLALALIAIHVAALAGIGSRMGFWHFSTGFTLLKWAAILALVSLATSLLGLWFTGVRKRRRGTLMAVLGLIVAMVTATPPLLWMQRAAEVPRIHDISTDTTDPPRFDAVVPLRREAPNPVVYGGAEIAAQQRQAYPEIQPLMVDQAPDEVFEQALALVQARGWQVVAADAEAGRIEATDTTFWFGFKDDVVIRIRAQDGGTRVDMRSLSRVGLSDVGTNARRIHGFLRALKARLS